MLPSWLIHVSVGINQAGRNDKFAKIEYPSFKLSINMVLQPNDLCYSPDSYFDCKVERLSAGCCSAHVLYFEGRTLECWLAWQRA